MGRIHLNLSLIYKQAFARVSPQIQDWLNYSEAEKNIGGAFAPLHLPGYTFKWDNWLSVTYLIMLGKVHY